MECPQWQGVGRAIVLPVVRTRVPGVQHRRRGSWTGGTELLVGSVHRGDLGGVPGRWRGGLGVPGTPLEDGTADEAGDYLLCYLTGISRWIGVLEVLSEPFKDHTPIWKDEEFPCRVRVRALAALTQTPATAVPVFELRDQLSVFGDSKNPRAWTGHFRGSPMRWKPTDGQAVVAAIVDAKDHPITRPVDAAKLARRARALKAAIGPVTVPDSTDEPNLPNDQAAEPRDPTAHTELQWSLLKLGNDMGLDVWVARNDRSRDWNGHRFTDLPRLRVDLPLQFDEATNRTIELIDVLWLKGNAWWRPSRSRAPPRSTRGCCAYRT
jgi:hypothetical protein